MTLKKDHTADAFNPLAAGCNQVILLAAGKGTRMKGAVDDKILIPLEGKSSFRRSYEAFADTGLFSGAVIVYRDEQQRRVLEENLTDLEKPIPELRWIQGGNRRQDSVFHGLTSAGLETDYVFIHDCARPLVASSDILALCERVITDKAASLARPVVDTIKRIDRRRTNYRNCTLRPIDRRGCWAMETPQAFEYKLIFDAYQRARQGTQLHTDDTSVASAAGAKISLVESSFPNPKITRPGDLAMISFLIRNPNLPGQDTK